MVWYGPVWCGMVSLARNFYLVWSGVVLRGGAGCGKAGLGPVRRGLVWSGRVWSGFSGEKFL